MNEENKKSRKWLLVLIILAIATIGAFVPPVLTAFILKSSTLSILTGGEFVTLVTLLVGAYFSANVFQKRVFVNADKSKSEEDEITIEIKPNEGGEA